MAMFSAYLCFDGPCTEAIKFYADTLGGELLLSGDLLLNPCAREPLPAEARFPRLRAYGAAPPAAGVRWLGPAPGPFAIDGG